MATRAVSTVVTYRAWDTSANAPKTGDSANHTLKWIKDGTSSTTTNAGAEVDSTNAKGTYKVTLTSTETDCTFGTLAGVSSTANVSIFGVEIGFEYVPTSATTFGAFVGNATAALGVDASGRVDVGKTLGTAVTLDANNVLNVSAKYWAGTAITATSIPVATAAGAAGGLFIAGTNAATTVTTSFTTTFTGNLTGSVGSVTGLTASNLDVAVSSRMATFALPTNFSALSITAGGLADITQAAADKVWSTAARILTAGTNIVLAKGTGVTGFNDVSAAQVTSAVWSATGDGAYTYAQMLGYSWAFAAGTLSGVSSNAPVFISKGLGFTITATQVADGRSVVTLS